MRLLDVPERPRDERMNEFRRRAADQFRVAVRGWVFTMVGIGLTERVADSDKLVAELRKLVPRLAPHTERYVRELADL